MSAGKAKDRGGSHKDVSSDETKQSPSEPESRRVLPTPVRASMGVDSADPEVAERTVELDGRTWFVRIAGESRGGRTLKNVGLVELEFEPVDGEGDSQRRLVVREAGRELSDLELEELLNGG